MIDYVILTSIKIFSDHILKLQNKNILIWLYIFLSCLHFIIFFLHHKYNFSVFYKSCLKKLEQDSKDKINTDITSNSLFYLKRAWAPAPLHLVCISSHHSHSSMRRVRHEAAWAADTALSFRCAACSPRSRCTSLTALSLQLCGVLVVEPRGAVHTAYSLKAYSCDGRQRGKTQPACINDDSHLAFSSTASHPHTLVTGISFAHLILRLFSTAHYLYGVTIITPTWKRKRLI